jgi:hypothetical protein
MRVMMMHKTNADNEAGIPPSREIIERMGQLMGKIGGSGILLDGGGLRATSTGVRLHFAGGQRTVTKGPFTGNNELMAGFAILKLKSMDEAIDWASRFAKVVGDVEIDIRPLVEPWDLGVMPKPPDLETTRFMLHHKATPESESGKPPSAKMMAEMGRLIEELQQSGVLLSTEGLAPSSKAKRLKMAGGKCTVLDGPFAESKELIAGYIMMNVKSLDEAIAWATPFAEIIGDVEIDMRPLMEETDVAQA